MLHSRDLSHLQKVYVCLSDLNGSSYVLCFHSPTQARIPTAGPEAPATLHSPHGTGIHPALCWVHGIFTCCRESVQESEAHSRHSLLAHLVSSSRLWTSPSPSHFPCVFRGKAENLLLLLEANLHPPVVFPGTHPRHLSLLSPHRPPTEDRAHVRHAHPPGPQNTFLQLTLPAVALSVLLPRTSFSLFKRLLHGSPGTLQKKF